MNKSSPMILPKSKFFHFGIAKPKNIAKFQGIFKLNHFSNIYVFNIGFLPWLSSRESK